MDIDPPELQFETELHALIGKYQNQISIGSLYGVLHFRCLALDNYFMHLVRQTGVYNNATD